MLHLDNRPADGDLGLENRRFGVNGVAVKYRPRVTNVGVFQRRGGMPAHVCLAHPDHQTDDDGPLH